MQNQAPAEISTMCVQSLSQMLRNLWELRTEPEVRGQGNNRYKQCLGPPLGAPWRLKYCPASSTATEHSQWEQTSCGKKSAGTEEWVASSPLLTHPKNALLWKFHSPQLCPLCTYQLLKFRSIETEPRLLTTYPTASRESIVTWLLTGPQMSPSWKALR